MSLASPLAGLKVYPRELLAISRVLPEEGKKLKEALDRIAGDPDLVALLIENRLRNFDLTAAFLVAHYVDFSGKKPRLMKSKLIEDYRALGYTKTLVNRMAETLYRRRVLAEAYARIIYNAGLVRDPVYAWNKFNPDYVREGNLVSPEELRSRVVRDIMSSLELLGIWSADVRIEKGIITVRLPWRESIEYDLNTADKLMVGYEIAKILRRRGYFRLDGKPAKKLESGEIIIYPEGDVLHPIYPAKNRRDLSLKIEVDKTIYNIYLAPNYAFLDIQRSGRSVFSDSWISKYLDPWYALAIILGHSKEKLKRIELLLDRLEADKYIDHEKRLEMERIVKYVRDSGLFIEPATKYLVETHDVSEYSDVYGILRDWELVGRYLAMKYPGEYRVADKKFLVTRRVLGDKTLDEAVEGIILADNKRKVIVPPSLRKLILSVEPDKIIVEKAYLGISEIGNDAYYHVSVVGFIKDGRIYRIRETREQFY